MASNVNLHDIDIEDIGKLSVVVLKDILREHREGLRGNKEMLVARCIALKSRLFDEPICVNSEKDGHDPFADFRSSKDITYDMLYASAKGRVWSDDLRRLCECNFHQLYDYLVVRTQKLDNVEMKGSCYKKLRSYTYFIEGNVSSVEVANGHGYTWVKCKVLASMKKTQYRVMVIFKSNGDIAFAACQCPAGLGVHGAGKCNHIGSLLFAVNSFTTHNLHSNPDKSSCTSKINGWIVPRNLNVDPKPISNIKVSREKVSSSQQQYPEESLYDPRAPQDRQLDHHALNSLYDNLRDCAPSSGFFLFHTDRPGSDCVTDDCAKYVTDLDSLDISSGQDVAFNTSVVSSTYSEEFDSSLSSNTSVKPLEIPLIEVDHSISDEMTIDEDFLQKYVDPIISKEVISDEDVVLVEMETKKQSDCPYWKKLHKYKLTSSNFGKVVKCRNPDSVLKSVLYSNPSSAALAYGKVNESNAVNSYVQQKKKQGCQVEVTQAGLVISKVRPGLGASLDGYVFDSSAEIKKGGLECKCPYNKAGWSVSDACKDNSFYLKMYENGKILLDRKHNYFLQIQGQMYVTGLKWVDFVVWFGNDVAPHIERIYFDESGWNRDYLPTLDLFYRWAFLPELLTRRVERGLNLIEMEQWKAFNVLASS